MDFSKKEQKQQLLIDTILLDAQKQARQIRNQILSQAQKEAKKIQQQGDARAARKKKAAEQQLQLDFRIGEQMHAQKLWKLLEEQALSQMLQWPVTKWANFMTRLIFSYAQPGENRLKIPSGDFARYADASLSAPMGGKETLPAFWQRRLFEKTGLSYSFCLDGSAPIAGGAILFQNEIKIDLSFESILSITMAQHEQELMQIYLDTHGRL